MYKPFFILISLLFFACHTPKQSSNNSTMTSNDNNEGWKNLLDGKTSAGWHRYGGGNIDSVWKVTDGMLWLDIPAKKAQNIKGDWDIVTDEEYENFDLQLDWKVSPKGNSGIIFLVHENKPKYNWPWQTGPEMQVLDNDGHPDAKVHKHRAGDLYDLVAGEKETVKPAGEWNTARIHLLNGKLDFFLNGVNVVSTSLWDD